MNNANIHSENNDPELITKNERRQLKRTIESKDFFKEKLVEANLKVRYSRKVEKRKNETINNLKETVRLAEVELHKEKISHASTIRENTELRLEKKNIEDKFQDILEQIKKQENGDPPDISKEEHLSFIGLLLSLAILGTPFRKICKITE